MPCQIITNLTAIVAAIFIVEGGDKAKVPYGILSVPVRNKAEARQICHNTVRNNVVRWHNAGTNGCYLDFLGRRYCPPASDLIGHRNWLRNMRDRLGHTNCVANTRKTQYPLRYRE